MSTKLIYLVNVFLMTLLSIMYSPASASNKPADITEAEWAMLPLYCPHTMGFKGHVQPYIAKWSNAMGNGFFNMHHHCWSLIDFHRSLRIGLSNAERRNLLQRALGGFQYVINNSPEDFILLPEILTWDGRSETLLGNAKNAAKEFNRAIAIKPDYWPAYFHLAELLNRKGEKKEALEVVKRGLKYAPNTKPLRLLFSVLGGKPNEIPKPLTESEKLTETEPVNATTEATALPLDKTESPQPSDQKAN